MRRVNPSTFCANDATVRSRRSWAMDVSVSARTRDRVAAGRSDLARLGQIIDLSLLTHRAERGLGVFETLGQFGGTGAGLDAHRELAGHAELHRTEDHQFVSLSHRKGGRLAIDVDGEVGQCRGGHLCRTSGDRGLGPGHLEFGGSDALDQLVVHQSGPHHCFGREATPAWHR